MPSNHNKVSLENFEPYHQAVAYLETLSRLPHQKRRNESLRRFSYFLNLIGNPHKKLTYIHVAGTSGKGSVATMIHEILDADGKISGLLVSPHTTTTIERIHVNNKLISPKEFSEIVEKIKPAIDRAHQSIYGQPTYFELMTAIAFMYFVQKKCAFATLEVGIGGRLDATNVIAAPKIAVINRVDFDHTELLGDTLHKIAKEKAGIIKPRSYVLVAGNNHRLALMAIKRACKKQATPLEIIKPIHHYNTKMSGPHQQQNAALAARATELLGVSQKAISKGLLSASLPCRFEIIQKNPLVILDGAHNRSKIESVLHQIDNLTYRKLYLIIALTHERQPRALFKKLSQRATEVIVTRFTSNAFKRCYSPNDLAQQLSCRRKKVFLDPAGALAYALSKSQSHDLILVTGSLYLTGQIRTHWRTEHQILTEQKS